MTPTDLGTGLAAARERVDRRFDDDLERIRDYLRLPSVSGTGEGIQRCAEATAELLESAGADARIVSTSGHPAVLASIEGDGPRLLRYGMYDVQPADEPNWTSPPFAAEVRDLPGAGRSIVARGSANSKGCLAAFALAVAAHREAADLPVSIVFLIDGEEELGSPALPQVVEANRDALRADAAFDLDLTADVSSTPEVYLGCKGILGLRLVGRGADWGGPVGRALHSSEGVVVASPAWSVVRALAALDEANRSDALPSLRRGEILEEDEPLLAQLADTIDTSAHLDEIGVRRFERDLSPREVVEALVYEPVINLNGVKAGYAAGGKTIIPHEAEAAVDVRLPYGTDTEEVLREITSLVAKVSPEVAIEDVDRCLPARTSATSPVAQAMIASHKDIGRPARVWPSAPWWAPYFLFEQVLELPFAVGGAGHSGGAHASDEFATVDGLREHMHQSLVFLHRFAQHHREVQ
jgi:acetylornithine deacetylase/succinyl-diaminopimelate desuccinylase-like protein